MKVKFLIFLFHYSFISLLWGSIEKKPNILLLTADDLGWDSLGCMGNPLPGLTPHLDELAAEGLLIKHAYVATPICGPSRQSIYTGIFPQQSGFMGHGVQPPLWWRVEGRKVIKKSITSHLLDHEYLTGLIGKHGSEWCRFSVPPRGQNIETGMGRNPQDYIEFTQDFILRAKQEKKPFFLAANTHDPHRYWANHENETPQWINAMMGDNTWKVFANGKPYPDPQKSFNPEDCPVPLPYHQDEKVQDLLATYYGSVNRMDEVVGGILQALDESGLAKNTIVLFLSDHGMAWDLSKWSLYPSGVRSPLIIRWPLNIPAGRVEEKAVVSVVDLVPTILDLCNLPAMDEIEGSSFKCILEGNNKNWKRVQAFSCFNYMNNEASIDQSISSFSSDLADKFEQYRPSRALNDPFFSYVWNGWSNGSNQLPGTMLGEFHGILSKAIEESKGKNNHEFSMQKLFIEMRCPEEFYHLKNDPACKINLASDPRYRQKLQQYRKSMRKILTRTNDHELQNFINFISTK